MLIVAVGAAALISLAVAVLTLGVGDAPAWWQVPVGIALIGVSRVFPMRLQLGSSATSQDWGEAALIVGLALLSPSWLLVAGTIGLTLGYAWIRLEAVKLFFNVAASMIAVAMACLVLVLLGSPQPDALTAGGAAVLLLAAAGSSVTTDVACARGVGLS